MHISHTGLRNSAQTGQRGLEASNRVVGSSQFRISHAWRWRRTMRLQAEPRPLLDQNWTPQLSPEDACTTCHQGITQSGVAPRSDSQANRAHLLIPHSKKEWGCTVCHRGQGVATKEEEAHQPKLASAQPLLPVRYIQASCGTCHRADLPETPQLNRGRLLLSEFGCIGCHRMEGIERPSILAPDLSSIGTKVSREWIYKWLKGPRTTTGTSGNPATDGYATEPRMPQFRLNEQELKSLSAYLSSLRSKPVEPYKFDPQVVATWQNKPELTEQGEARFRQMFCTTCHPVAVTRAGNTTLIGGDIGPELTKVGSKVNPDWLVAWLRDPQARLSESQMPRYEWSDQDLYVVTRYIGSKLKDPDLLNDVPKLEPPSQEEVRFGHRVFLQKGCGSCHAVQGMKLQKDFGPDLSSLGAESASHLDFGHSNLPHDLVAYIQARIDDPCLIKPDAEMPQYHFNSEDMDAITTALLAMTGAPANAEMARLVVPQTQAEFHPSGAYENLYERYKCYVCHQFNGYGGTLAPDLSYEGSRAQRQWMINFLRNPLTLRPALTLRMPQFNMTDKEASMLADFMNKGLQHPRVNPASVDLKQLTPPMQALGKQLYEAKYQCQACHTIEGAGGYVGPDLSNVGNWLTAAWIEAWLTDPQELVPGSIEPRRTLTEDEIKALTAYLMSLRQGGPAAQAAGGGD